EPVVPSRPHVDHPPQRVGERRRRELVLPTADLTPSHHESGILQQGEVLRDGLTRHGHARRELGQRRRAGGRQRAQEARARRVGQGLEDSVVVASVHRPASASAGAARSVMRTRVPVATRWRSIVTNEGSPIRLPNPAPRCSRQRQVSVRNGATCSTRPRRSAPPANRNRTTPPGSGSSQASAPNQAESAAGSTMNPQTSSGGASMISSWTSIGISLGAPRHPATVRLPNPAPSSTVGNRKVAIVPEGGPNMRASGVPTVVERSGSGEQAFDIYSRLLRERVVFLGSELNDELANLVIAQLLFLEADSPDRDVSLYVNSPGGDVTALFAIY